MSQKIIWSANVQSTCLGGPLMQARAHLGDVENFTYEPGNQSDQVMVTGSPGLRIASGLNQGVSNRDFETNCAQKQ